MTGIDKSDFLRQHKMTNAGCSGHTYSQQGDLAPANDCKRANLIQMMKSLYDKVIRKLSEIYLSLYKAIIQPDLCVVVGTGHRVGSTWLYRLLASIGRFDKKLTDIPFVDQEYGTIKLSDSCLHRLQHLKGYHIYKSHSRPPDLGDIETNLKFVSIYRDPRDALVSLSYFDAHLDEEKGGRGAAFRALPMQARLVTLIETFDLCDELERWFESPIAFKIRYEDLQRTPVQTLQDMCAYLALPAHTKRMQQILNWHSFERKTGREPGIEIQDSPMRKGVIGDWRNVFDAQSIAAFKHSRSGRWNQLLLKMGYESTPDWM
jgi:hypothetical protein